jgi:hypothetical protein
VGESDPRPAPGARRPCGGRQRSRRCRGACGRRHHPGRGRAGRRLRRRCHRPATGHRPGGCRGQLGITVNTVAPGFVPVERHADVPGEVRSAYLASVPAGRMGTPADVAHAVSFFASEAAGFVTGQRLVVDGVGALAADARHARAWDPGGPAIVSSMPVLDPVSARACRATADPRLRLPLGVRPVGLGGQLGRDGVGAWSGRCPDRGSIGVGRRFARCFDGHYPSWSRRRVR